MGKHRRPVRARAVAIDPFDQPDLRPALIGLVLLLLAETAVVLAGGSPGLLPALVLLAYAAVRPFAGLVYALIVTAVPLGLWLLGLQANAAQVFAGRDYVLSLSSALVLFGLFAVTVVPRIWRSPRLLAAATVACCLLAGWVIVGFFHHGVPQTLVGVRLTLLPLVVLAIVAGLSIRDVRRLIGVLSWLLVANAVAAVGEVLVGPARLVAWGFEEERAIRFIGGTFRAPGLTEVNAELGLLAGAYLLGYTGLWLTRVARPPHWSWHAGAVASAICLALSTSRSGAILLVGGVVTAVVLDRSGDQARRRRSQLLGGLLVVGVAGGFAVLGASGANSLFQRVDVWLSLLSTDLPLAGRGIGSIGAATYSRVADGPQVFVDNYFVSAALQFGPLAMLALFGAIAVALIRLSRDSATHPVNLLYLAIVAGLSFAFLFIEAWEYAAAMMSLALFVAYGLRVDRRGQQIWPSA